MIVDALHDARAVVFGDAGAGAGAGDDVDVDVDGVVIAVEEAAEASTVVVALSHGKPWDRLAGLVLMTTPSTGQPAVPRTKLRCP